MNTTNSLSSQGPVDVQNAMRLFISVCMGCIIAVSLFGNVLVCIAFKVNEHLRSVSNYFILNLAVSDLITTIFVMPFDLDIILKRGIWAHGEPTCHFYTTMYLISAPASILNLLAVSIDRWRVISDPFVYERTTTPFRALIVIAFIWTYATLMALLPVMGWKDTNTVIENSTALTCFFPIPLNYSILISVLHFVIPPLIMAMIYFKIYQIARSHVRRIHRLESITGARPAILSPNTANNSHRPSSKVLLSPPKNTDIDRECTSNGVNGHSTIKMLKRKITYRYSVSAPPMLRKNVKAAKSLAVIVGTFFACWYPFTAVSMTVNACGGFTGGCHVEGYVFDCLITIGYLNCVLNPFLYAFHNAEFKKTYKRILRCK